MIKELIIAFAVKAEENNWSNSKAANMLLKANPDIRLAHRTLRRKIGEHRKISCMDTNDKIKVSENTDSKEYEYQGERSLTSKEDAVKFFKINLKEEEIERSVYNSWDVTMNTPDGPIKRTNYQVKLYTKKISSVNYKKIYKDIDRFYKDKPKVSIKNGEGNGTIVVALADLHIGAKSNPAKGLINTKDFSLKHLITYLNKTAERINSLKKEKVYINFLGDYFESISGMNHLNSWQGMEEDAFGANVLILAEQIISKFLSQINNLVEVNMISGNHCYDAETEVLTNNGWKLFTELNKDDVIATFNNDLKVEYQNYKPVETVSDQTIIISNTNSEQRVTPDHKCTFYKDGFKYNKKAKDVTTEDLKYLIKGVEFESPDDYAISDDLLKLLVWIVCDATLVSDKNPNSIKKRVQFKLSKERKITELKTLLDKLDMPYTFREATMSKSNKLQPYYIRIYGDTARYLFTLLNDRKQFPEWFRNLSKRQVNIVYETLGITDGRFQRNGEVLELHSIVKKDIDLLQEMFVLNGYRVRVGERKSKGFKNGKLQYILTVERTTSYVQKLNIEVINHEPKPFYCVEVPNGEIITRYKGKIAYSGNCRLHPNKELDAKGDGGKLLAYMLSKNFDVKYHSMVLSAKIDGIGYVMYHGHQGLSKQNLSKIILDYGFKDVYNVCLSGHLHSRNTKKEFYKIDHIIQDSAQYRGIVVAPLFTGNYYSESSGWTSSAGFSIIEANEDKSNINHYDFSL